MHTRTPVLEKVLLKKEPLKKELLQFGAYKIRKI